MLPKWLLCAVLLCGMLVAPAAMAGVSAHPSNAAQTVRHCTACAPDHRLPSQHVHCMGACSGVEVDLTRIVDRIDPPSAIIAIPTVSSLSGILLELDTPPPRLS